jgi:hypothetical protein
MSVHEHENEKRQPENYVSAAEGIDVNLDHELLRLGHDVIDRQKSENFSASWKNHWRAAGWSLFISMALWMEGFDNALVSRFAA